MLLRVGGNPLASYRSVRTLSPSRVTIVHSPATQSPARRLAALLDPQMPDRVDLRSVEDAADAGRVRELCARHIDERTWVDSTGGTNAVSAQARLALEHVAPQAASRATYVDESSATLRFDDGLRVPLQVDHTVDELLSLHGAARVQGAELDEALQSQAPSDEDACAVTRAAIDARRPFRFDKWLQHTGRNKLRGQPQKLPARSPQRCIQRLPTSPGWPAELIGEWRRFLGGGWLEQFTALCFRRVNSGVDVEVNLVAQRLDRTLEIDVLAAHAGRPHVVSCTISKTGETAQAKAYEAAHRTGQLDGDRARAALVTLMADGDGSDATRQVDAVQHDLDESWDAPVRTVVYGREHLSRRVDGNSDDLEVWPQTLCGRRPC